MTITSRLTPAILSILMLSGCISTATAISDTHRLVSADPIQTEFIVTTSGTTAPVTLSPAAPPGFEKEYLGFVLIDSGAKCQAFADRLSTAQRGVDTSFDILSGILSALATALSPLSTVHALTAAATISTGTKSAIAADVYAKATASLILQQINNTYYVDIDNYRKEIIKRDASSIVPALEVSRIQAIHRECSLDSAIASLSQAGAVTAAALGALSGAVEGAKTATEKGLSADAGAIAGAALGAAAGASGGAAAAPEAAAKQGAAAAAAVGTPPPPAPVAAGPSTPPSLPPSFAPVPAPANPIIGIPQGNKPVSLLPSPKEPIQHALGNFETTLFPSEGRRIQRALCLKSDAGIVDFGPETRRAIQMFRTTTTGQNLTAGISDLDHKGLTKEEGVLLLNIGDCNKHCYWNSYEYGEYGPKAAVLANMTPAGDSEKKLNSLLRLLAWAAGGDIAAQNIKDFCDPATRNLIVKALGTHGISHETSLSASAVNALKIAQHEKEHEANPVSGTPSPK